MWYSNVSESKTKKVTLICDPRYTFSIYLPDATGVEKSEIESFKWNIFMLWRNSASVLSNWRSKKFWIAFRNIGASCGRKSAPTREKESPKYIDWAKIDSIWPEQLNKSSETRISLSCTLVEFWITLITIQMITVSRKISVVSHLFSRRNAYAKLRMMVRQTHMKIRHELE